MPDLPQQPVSPLDTVRYATDMLENLRRMAAGQGLDLLAHLLELAQTEARMIVRDAADNGRNGCGSGDSPDAGIARTSER